MFKQDQSVQKSTGVSRINSVFTSFDNMTPDYFKQFFSGVSQNPKKNTEQTLKYEFASQIIFALLTMLEMRDPSTAHHQKRVSLLAKAIALEMGLPSKQVDNIYLAAIIHDIGKFLIPTEILCKPGKITDLEFDLIKTHVELGFKILNKIKSLQFIAQIVGQHHERLNGCGYPQGITGEKILLEAKILAVADVVDAISSHRPYRPSLGLDAAIEEICQKQGTLFDSDVVNTCIILFRQKSFSFND